MSHPWDQVSDPNYFRRMFQNTRRLYLHNRKEARVRLSLSSDPSAPDYRVESPDGYQFDCAGSGQGDVDMSQLSEQTLSVDEIRQLHRAFRERIADPSPSDSQR